MSFQFETARLVLRPWRADDRPWVARMTGDADMMRYLTGGQPMSDEQTDELINRQTGHLAAHGICMGAVQLKDTGEVIGLAGLQPIDSGEFELGWWIWKAHWSRGYASEAIAPYIQHARQVMGLRRLVAVINPDNAPSRALAERLGMRFERIMSARKTVARRDDVPVAFYGMALD